MILGNRWTEVPLDHVVTKCGVFILFSIFLLLLTLKKRIHSLLSSPFIITKKKKKTHTDQSLTVFRLKHCCLLGPPKKQILKWGLQRRTQLIWQLQVHWQGSNDTGERMKGSFLSYWSLIPLGSSGKQYKTYASELSWTSGEGTGVLILLQPLGIA